MFSWLSTCNFVSKCNLLQDFPSLLPSFTLPIKMPCVHGQCMCVCVYIHMCKWRCSCYSDMSFNSVQVREQPHFWKDFLFVFILHIHTWITGWKLLRLFFFASDLHDHRDNKCGVQKHDFCLASGLQCQVGRVKDFRLT